MTLDSIVAVVGLLIAAYQIMPRWRQLDLAFRFRWPDWVIAAGGAAFLIYLQFFPVFAAVGFTPSFGLARINLTPQLASFIVVVVAGVVLGVHLRGMALSPGRVARFSRLVEELELAREHAALFTIMDRYLKRLAEIARGETSMMRRRKWLFHSGYGFDRETGTIDMSAFSAMSSMPEDRESEVSATPRHGSRTIGWLREAIGPRIGRLLPNQRRGQTAARDILDRLLTSREFVAAIVDLRPYLGLRIIAERLDRHGEFLTPYLRLLLRTPSSILHRELRDNQGLWASRQQEIPEDSRLLFALLSDAHVAEKLAIYKPLGDEMLAILRELRRAESDPYNAALDTRFKEDDRWESPLFVGVHVFAIMVAQSLNQNVMWHMWLYYLRDVVGEVVTNYAPHGTDYNPEAEFPTRYSYLMYEIFDVMRDWIKPVVKLAPAGQANVNIERTSVAHENFNIPKSSIRALVESHRILVAGERIEPSFKCHITDMIFNLYFDLIGRGVDQYADLLITHINSADIYPRRTDAYGEHLRACYETFDRIPHRQHTEKFERALFGTVEV
jgi:hypothetical protein